MEGKGCLFQQLILSTQVQNYGYLWMFSKYLLAKLKTHILPFAKKMLLDIEEGRGFVTF